MFKLADTLERDGTLDKEGFAALISGRNPEIALYLREKAAGIRDRVFGKGVFLRGLLEFSNYCRNDCLYCGIRRSNRLAERYRLNLEEILESCREGYELGFRTFVLQSGEDPHYGEYYVSEIVAAVKNTFPDAAITLSLGERSREAYARWRKSGADRYLLRHETRNPDHYKKLHPADMKLSNRLRCLYDLKDLGYQVGCGFMVGSPFQRVSDLAEDLLFIKELSPQMVGIGPFIPHKDTPFKDFPPGDVDLTLYLLSIIRIMEPSALLPATTALGSLDGFGREKGVLSGANVIMPILTPPGARKKYLLYDNKICTGDRAAECRFCVARRLDSIGHGVDVSRGDHPGFRP
ncbi:MAG: [FeFe] hydrogenase H-cluster radical SAM maturase HydE [Deltaproteobacteria bacterium]|jgi:biotin synthase|nr:[FeFe] hydrogenase H-cluster radical SAM maturase HydE [Deltaproteobacteria bacterium]